MLYKSVNIQSFFCTGGLQKYFIVNLANARNNKNVRVKQQIQAQLAEYKLTQQEVEEELQTLTDIRVRGRHQTAVKGA